MTGTLCGGAGRFISEDVAKAGVSWYAYCSNNPLSKVDPDGLLERPAGMIVDGCAGGYASPPGKTPGKLPEVPNAVGDSVGFVGPLLIGLSEQKRPGAIVANKAATLDYLASEPGAAAAVKSTAKVIDTANKMNGTGKALGILGWGLTAYSELCAGIQSVTSKDWRPIIKTTVTNGLEVGGSFAGGIGGTIAGSALTVETVGVASPVIPVATATGCAFGGWFGRTVGNLFFEGLLGWVDTK